MTPAAVFAPQQRVTVLMRRHGPRLLVASKRAWPASALYPAQRPSARALRFVLRLLAAVRPGRRRAELAHEDVPAWVRDLEPLRPVAVLVGTPRPAQKLTVRFDDPAGRPVLFAKVGSRPVARRRLRNERTMLEALPPGFAPRAVGWLEQPDHDVLLLEAVAGRPSRWRHVHAARAWLEKLVAAAGRQPQGDHPLLVRLWHEESGLRPWLERLDGREWLQVPVHGDFAPWNVLRRRGGLVAVDWEYALPDGLPGMDLAYWSLQTDALLFRRSAREARLRAREVVATACGLSEEAAEALVRITARVAHQAARADGHRRDAPLQRWREEVAPG